LYGLLRGAAQGLWTSLIAYLLQHGIVVPEPVANALQGWFVDVVIVGGAFGLVTGGIQWLESRKGDGFWPRAARKIAQWLMLGLSKAPVYAPTDTRATPVTVAYANGQEQPALKA
jgi:hypothetical protein